MEIHQSWKSIVWYIDASLHNDLKTFMFVDLMFNRSTELQIVETDTGIPVWRSVDNYDVHWQEWISMANNQST